MFDNELLPTDVQPIGGSTVIKQDGVTFTGIDATAVGRPVMDGSENYGAGPKVIDEWLDDQPGQIKSNFYSWYNRAKVTSSVGLSVRIQAYKHLDPSGVVVDQPETTLNISANATVFIVISENGDLNATGTLPSQGVALALVTTDNSTVTEVVDIREQVSTHVRNLQANGGFSIGDIKETCASTGGDGFVPLDNNVLYSAATFPLGFAIIGRTFSRPGDPSNTFRVPPGDSFSLVSGDSHTLGEVGGEEQVALNANQNGRHTHALSDPGHSHGTQGGEHSHGVNDPEHGHSIYGSTEASDSRVDSIITEFSGVAGEQGGNKFYVDVTANGQGVRIIKPRRTGISIQEARGNVFVTPSSTNVTLADSGTGAAHNNMPPYYVINKFIRIA
jgi:microcystin-dependent protein